MEAGEISNRRSLEKWLKRRPRADALCIAQRAALRAFPLWAATMDDSWARQRNLTALPVLRSMLTSGVVRRYPTPDVQEAARAAVAARADADGIIAAALEAADKTIGVAYDAFVDTVNAYAAAYTAFAALGNGSSDDIAPADSEVPEAVRIDAFALQSGIDPSNTRLWPAAPPGWYTAADLRARAIWDREPVAWFFWLRWWDGMVAGKPLDWELQRDVALIPDEDWEKGPAHIARLIAIIEERHRLLAIVKDLKESLAKTTDASTALATPEHRGHNQPPELVDAPAQLRETVTVFRKALDEAETELAKPDPAPSVLRRISATLADVVKVIAIWCGGKLDVFVTEAAKEAGKSVGNWGVKAMIATLAVTATSGQMQSLIKGLADLASKLLP